MKDLAERTDGAYSKSRISNYEQGLRRLSVEAAQAVGAALGNVMGAYLLCLHEGPTGCSAP
ncbi:helix-turn-helix domain-containing protein [uncultured Thiohalocapsa sp.]|uniref:helix-turn-helix domain-containing protein n=1 Tax=uncultured Thiohalocapsa sp. TaxID=768990 RepID=UPI00345CFDE6